MTDEIRRLKNDADTPDDERPEAGEDDELMLALRKYEISLAYSDEGDEG